MKRFILPLLLACVCVPSRGEQLEWLTDAEAAKAKAKEENKFVLLDFTGSDWCGWCMKLKAEVFDQPEFAAFAREHLVLVEVDFPKRKQLDAAQQEANNRLEEQFRVTGYPTIILLNSDGKAVGKTGYLEGGPRAFNAELSRILKIDNDTSPEPPQKKPEAPHKPPTLETYPPQVPIKYGPLTLKGLSGTKDHRFALINNVTLAVGDWADVKTGDKRVSVICKEIRDDSVLITADGKPMELKLKKQ